ncbi:MAG: type III-A CRISPR-associated RAMP protein Csm3 [Lachnospiraceae bacterium]|nr:type III-A CRISPR-associated RAMP protein Csm3 [Lachnospiraceae bacterium]
MYGKIQITGIMETVTGTHIGGSSEFSAIGAVDSPVIRDAATNMPMIPGSSLKGKMRTLLAKAYSDGLPKKHDEDDPKIVRLFGGSAKVEGKIPHAKLLFSDMILCNREELYANGAQGLTEVKFENTINRLTAVANPRQIERVIRGAQFPLDIIYEVYDEGQIEDDMKLLAQGFRLLKYDYIGGSGSRGYGKVSFSDLEAKGVIGEVSDNVIQECNRILKENI